MKPGALTGAQVDERTLATAPSATSVEVANAAAEAQRSAEAQRAGSVSRATVAESVPRVPVAGRADLVPTAPTADRALQADFTDRLEGRLRGDFQERDCKDGSVKASITARGRGTADPEVLGEFMCNGEHATLGIFHDVAGDPVPGLYTLALRGLPDRFGATPTGSAPGLNTIVSIRPFPAPSDFFTVRVSSSHGVNDRGTELFTVTVF